jgi:hypothetical protein
MKSPQVVRNYDKWKCMKSPQIAQKGSGIWTHDPHVLDGCSSEFFVSNSSVVRDMQLGSTSTNSRLGH